MVDLTNNLWAVTVGGTLIATVAGGYLLNSFSKRKEDREIEAHLKSRLNYAYELRDSGCLSDSLGICEGLLTEVSEVKHPALYGEVKFLAGNLRSEIHQAANSAAAPLSTVHPDVPSFSRQTNRSSTSISSSTSSSNFSFSAGVGQQQLPPLARLKEDLKGVVASLKNTVKERRQYRRWKRRHRGKKSFLYAASVFIWLALSSAAGQFHGASLTEPILFWSWVMSVTAITFLYHPADQEEELPLGEQTSITGGVKETAPVLQQQNHPMLIQINDLLSSLELELKQVPKDLASPFKGIQSDLQVLREKANKLNDVWKNVTRLLSQMVPIQEGETQNSLPPSVQEQEAKTKKNLEDLKSHIQAQMAETLAMLRALIAQVIQLKASPRLTEPDSFSQIRDNLSQRLIQLEAVEDTFHPFQTGQEKS